MAIVEMRRLSIYSTKNNRKKILEFLQEIGAMEIDEIQSDDIPFEKMDTSGERIRFQKKSPMSLIMLLNYSVSMMIVRNRFLILRMMLSLLRSSERLKRIVGSIIRRRRMFLNLKKVYSRARRPSLVSRIR